MMLHLVLRLSCSTYHDRLPWLAGVFGSRNRRFKQGGILHRDRASGEQQGIPKHWT